MSRCLVHLRHVVALFESNPGVHYLPELLAAIGHALELDMTNAEVDDVARRFAPLVRSIDRDRRQRAVTECVTTLTDSRCSRDYFEAFDPDEATPRDVLRWIQLGARRLACPVVVPRAA
ncbi:hypothetical protein HYS28_01190 [Candidatus Uhrbacteria bacterium]|nr:hypothetical protein [Candidatus Uhrbacteria bacterium]